MSMSLLIAGRTFGFIVLLIIMVGTHYLVYKAKQGKLPNIRRIPALEAVNEAVKRCTEMGAKVLVMPGRQGFSTKFCPETLAGIEVLSYVAEITASTDTDLMAVIQKPEVVPAATEVVRTSYVKAGNEYSFDIDMIRFFSPDATMTAAALMGIIPRENVQTLIMCGDFGSEALMWMAAAAYVGAFQIAGCATNLTQLPFMATVCNYILIADEVYAAGAYLSDDIRDRTTVAGSDIGKLVAIVLIFVGIILSLFNITLIDNLLKM